MSVLGGLQSDSPLEVTVYGWPIDATGTGLGYGNERTRTALALLVAEQ